MLIWCLVFSETNFSNRKYYENCVWYWVFCALFVCTTELCSSVSTLIIWKNWCLLIEFTIWGIYRSDITHVFWYLFVVHRSFGCCVHFRKDDDVYVWILLAVKKKRGWRFTLFQRDAIMHSGLLFLRNFHTSLKVLLLNASIFLLILCLDFQF